MIVTCKQCQIKFERRTIDVVRAGNGPLFCSSKCFGLSRLGTGKTWSETKKFCLFCKKEFTVTNNYKTVFCSRSCASKGSMSDERREAQRSGGYNSSHLFNTRFIAKSLKKREAWKYVELEEILKNVDHEFEFELNDFVYDLVLKDVNVIIEFDSDYHFSCTAQTELDETKQEVAELAGYTVIRLTTKRNSVIPASILDNLRASR